MMHSYQRTLAEAQLVVRTGRVRRIQPTYLEADGPDVSRGALCSVETSDGGSRSSVMAQVVSVSERSVVLAPFEDSPRTFVGAQVQAHNQADLVGVGDVLNGRVVDALGRPLDDAGPIRFTTRVPLMGSETSPLARTSPARPLVTGIRAIDGMLTLGLGQRVGIFAPSGVGKTSLVSQLAAQTSVDRCILCLVGERGREVEALWSSGLGADDKRKTTVIAATSDQAAVMRIRAVDYALALADHWRGKGLQVLLIVDSITRYAMALREVGLAAGEPPTVRAYTPSVFSIIPKVVERCGALKAGGSISAVMTVLSETEDNDDPICELMKSLLDGHIILSRSLAEQGHFPAIDVPRSVSRLAGRLMDADHLADARKAGGLLSIYDASKMMIEAGVYAPGSDPQVDQAIASRPAILRFLQQPTRGAVSFAVTRAGLAAITGAAA